VFVTVPRYTFTPVVPAGSAAHVSEHVPFSVIATVASFDPVVSPFWFVPVIFQKYVAAANVPPPTFAPAASVDGGARDSPAVNAWVA
jgi:hypothetical protein